MNVSFNCSRLQIHKGIIKDFIGCLICLTILFTASVCIAMLGRRLLLVGLTLVYLSFSKVSSLEPDPLGKGLTCSSLNLDPVCCHGDSFGNQYNLCDPGLLNTTETS